MSKLLDSKRLTGNNVLDLCWQRGSLLDRSGYGNHIAGITNPEAVFWARNKLGHALRITGIGRPYCADSTSLKLYNTAFTLVSVGNFDVLPNATSRLMAKRAAGATGSAWDVYVNGAAGSVVLYDASTESTMSAPVVGSRMIAVTLGAPAQKPKLYIDGSYKAEGNSAVTIPNAAGNPPLYIGNIYTGTGPLGNLLSRSLLFNVALSAAEIAQLYQELMSERYPLRAYSFGSRISAPVDPPGCPSLLKTDFTTRLPDGRLADLSGNGWHGTIKPGFAAGPGMCGNALMAAPTTRSYVDFGDVTPINGASKLTVLWYGKRGPSSSAEVLFDKGTSGTASNHLGVSTGVFWWQIGNGKNASVNDTNVNTDVFQAWAYDGGNADNAKKVRVHLDNAQPTVTVSASLSTTLPDTTGTPLQLGRIGWLNNYQPLKQNDFIAFYNATLTPEQVSYVYRQIARRSTFSLDMSRVPVSLANMVGPCEVPGTPFRLQSGGTWKVSEDAAGKRWFESVAGNNGAAAYVYSDKAHGTWVFDVYHTTASEYLWFLGNTINVGDTARNGYALYLTGTSVTLYRYDPSGAFASLLASSNCIAVGNAYSFAIPRTSGGQFTVCIKGGAYTKWTLLPATSGTNPVTSAQYTTSKYALFATTTPTGAAKFSQPRFFQGPLSIDQLQELAP